MSWLVRAANWGKDGGERLISMIVIFGAGVVLGMALTGAF